MVTSRSWRILCRCKEEDFITKTSRSSRILCGRRRKEHCAEVVGQAETEGRYYEDKKQEEDFAEEVHVGGQE